MSIVTASAKRKRYPMEATTKPLAERPVHLVEVAGVPIAFCDGEIAGEDRNIVRALRKRLAVIEEPSYGDFLTAVDVMCERRGIEFQIVDGGEGDL